MASEKTAVDQASRRARARDFTRASIGRASAATRAAPKWLERSATIRAARRSGRFHAMANIKQQKKRVRTAARERLENLRYRSTV